MRATIFASLFLLVMVSCKVSHTTRDKPCGNPRYTELMRIADRSPLEQAEFDSLDRLCDNYFDSLAATKSRPPSKGFDSTATIIIIAVVAIALLVNFLSGLKFG